MGARTQSKQAIFKTGAGFVEGGNKPGKRVQDESFGRIEFAAFAGVSERRRGGSEKRFILILDSEKNSKRERSKLTRGTDGLKKLV